MGIDWADFTNDGALGLAIGNFANEMTALYVTDQPASLQFSDLANLYGLGAPTQPPLKFGLFFFDYDLDGRLDLLSANGHLETDIAKVQASETYEQPAQLFWNTGKPGRDALRPGRPRDRRPRPVQADRRPRQRLCRHRRRRRPRRRPDASTAARPASSATTAATPTTGSASTSRATARPRTATPSAPRSTVKAGDQVCRRQLFPAKSYLSSVELPLTFGLGKADKADEVDHHLALGQGHEAQGPQGRSRLHIDEEEDCTERSTGALMTSGSRPRSWSSPPSPIQACDEVDPSLQA